MENHESPAAPPHGVLPPASPIPPVAAEKPSDWPMAIGVIAIVFGAGGIFGALWGILGPWLNPLFNELIDPQGNAPVIETGYEMWGVGLSVVSLAVAAWLLWRGIALVKLQPVAASRLKQWAVVKMVLTLAGAGFMAFTMPAIMEATQQQQPQASPPGLATSIEWVTQMIVIVSVVLGVVWGWALPVFVLVWFGRKKITAEVASWSDEPGRD